MDFEWTNPHKSAFNFDPSFSKSLNNAFETPTKKRIRAMRTAIDM
jgi:hypothetical protein